ncbi:hypothetical protein BH23GEM6_BH23GEM6_26510 [soil metagenome]
MLFDFAVLAFRRISGRTHRGRSFSGQQITLDGQTFIDCRFVGCTLVLLGSDRVSVEGCTFEGCRWAVAGFAGNTIETLRELSDIAGVAEVIRHTFADVFDPESEDEEESGADGENPEAAEHR